MPGALDSSALALNEFIGGLGVPYFAK